MKWEEIAQLPRERLLALLQDAYRNLIRVDGYWFLEMEKLAGQSKAVRADEEVWKRLGRVDAFQVRRNFELEGEGIPTLVAALRLSPIWPFFAEYQVEQTAPGEALFRVLRCNSQVERVKAGLGVFPCQGVEANYFSSFAQTINPHIGVSCISSPPDNYSEDLWCQWRFTLAGEG